jgi:hypothetical protein
MLFLKQLQPLNKILWLQLQLKVQLLPVAVLLGCSFNPVYATEPENSKPTRATTHGMGGGFQWVG